MKLDKARFCRTLVLLMGIAMFSAGSAKVEAAKDETICDGVYIDEINISGMTKEEAKEAVNKYVDDLMDKEIAVVLDQESIITKLGDLGYTCNENTYIEEASNVGKMGNLIKRYKELKDVQNGGLHYELEFSLPEENVYEFINTQCSIYDIPAKNAMVQRRNGQFVYEAEKTGRKLNVEATYDVIADAILNDWNQLDLVVNAVIEDDIPQYSLETVQKCNTLLGSYSTNYSTSTSDRKKNVENASKLIHNSIIYPGEVFSCYDKMNPFTTANGYYGAGAYANGMVVESIGGGVCQVSTTLYVALLEAELEITERAAHSMTVAYVPVGFDAAIAGTYKDLKFRNNLDVPVLVEAVANGRTVTFNIYGCETRDTANRRVEYKSEVISKTEPPKDVIKEDPTKPTTYREVTQSAHTGYVAILYKYVYENGVLVDTIRVNKSTYSAAPNYITVGTMVVEEEEEVVEEDEVVDEDENATTKPDSKPEQNEDDTTEVPDESTSNQKPNDTAQGDKPDANEDEATEEDEEVEDQE